MATVIGFLTPEGVLIATSGVTAADALGELADQWGEDAALAWSRAQDDVAQIIADLAQGERVAPPRAGAADAPPAGAAGLDGGGGGGEGVSAAGGPAEGSDEAEAEEVDEAAGEGVGAEQEQLRMAGGSAPEPSAPICSICAELVPVGLADLALDRFGDVRCRVCGNW